MREGLLLKGGGHAMAAGVTLRKDALAGFRAYLEDALAAAVEAARRESALAIDGAVSGRGGQSGAGATCWRAPGRIGAGNPEPLLALPAHTLAYADAGRRQSYPRALQVRRRQNASMRLRSAPPASRSASALLDNRGRPMHAAGHLAVDRWQGEERVQMRLVDVAMS